VGGDGWRVGVINLAVLAYVSRGRATVKKVINFFKKIAPQRRSWLCLWAL